MSYFNNYKDYLNNKNYIDNDNDNLIVGLGYFRLIILVILLLVFPRFWDSVAAG